MKRLVLGVLAGLLVGAGILFAQPALRPGDGSTFGFGYRTIQRAGFALPERSILNCTGGANCSDDAAGKRTTINVASSGTVGPGTVNFIPSFNTTTSVANSSLSDNGTNVSTPEHLVLGTSSGFLLSDTLGNRTFFANSVGTGISTPAGVWEVDQTTGAWNALLPNSDLNATRDVNATRNVRARNNGTAGAPTYALGADPTTGLYTVGTDDIAVTCHGQLCAAFSPGASSHAGVVSAISPNATASTQVSANDHTAAGANVFQLADTSVLVGTGTAGLYIGNATATGGLHVITGGNTTGNESWQVTSTGNLTSVGASRNISASGSLTVGGSTPTAITNIRVYAPSLTPGASSAAIQTAEQTFTVTGLTTADKVFVNGPAPTSLCPPVTYRVSAADTLAIGFLTLTAAGCTPAAGVYNIVAIRS